MTLLGSTSKGRLIHIGCSIEYLWQYDCECVFNGYWTNCYYNNTQISDWVKVVEVHCGYCRCQLLTRQNKEWNKKKAVS